MTSRLQKLFLIKGDEGTLPCSFTLNMIRIGTGYDTHRLVTGRKLILGGTEIKFDKGLAGHSDADILTHAIMDALLGAAALGDIGVHFPVSDPRYTNISSLILLHTVTEMLDAQGWKINNIDATIIAQEPLLSPFISEMRLNISRTLHTALECVSIKATTTEGMGFCGRGEGISAQAVALIERKEK